MPSCVFLIAGVLVGPYGLSLFAKHAEVANFFSELGKLLLMFFVGLEIDLEQYRINRLKSLIFGFLTFALPFMIGVSIGFAFSYRPLAAVLIGSLLASHTLIGYPMVQACGAVARPAVVITVGATILTDILSLLVLAVCVAIFKSGFDAGGLAIQIGEIGVFVLLVVEGLSVVGKWLFHQFGKTDEACFALLLVIVSIAATLAEYIHLEGIVGAFLAGLAMNAAVRDSPAKDKLQFLGNVLFVPAFFMATGFLVNPNVFYATLAHNMPLVLAVVIGLIGAKWLASEIAGRMWHWAAIDRGLMGSLTIPQVAAALATALVGYQALNAAGERLLDQTMLNTVLVLVVMTSLTGPLLTERRLPMPKGGPRAEGPLAAEMEQLGTPALATAPSGNRTTNNDSRNS